MEVADEQLDTISDPLTHFLMGEGRTHAELMRMHAIDATNEGGVWFSGEYATMLADAAESLEEENAKLRELLRDMYAVVMDDFVKCDLTYFEQFDDRMRELGVDE